LRRDIRFSPSLGLEGARLIYYTPTGKPLEENYKKYLEVLLKTIESIGDLTPFVQSNIAEPACLKKNFPTETPG